MIGQSALKSMINDEGLVGKQNLMVLAAPKIIENVHIYKIMDLKTTHFFASYNKKVLRL